MTNPGPAVFFASANSRRGAEWFAPAVDALNQRGVELYDSRLFESAEDLLDAVRSTGIQRVIIGGGDGTVSAVAREFENTGRVLGVMPFGTGNAFARDLGIPADFQIAAEVIANGRTAQVDVGVANGKRFLNVATFGLTTLIARELDSGLKKISSTAAYMLAVIRALQRVRPFQVNLTIGEDVHKFETLQVVVGNGRFHAGSLLIAEEAALDAGVLKIYALTGRNKLDLLKLAWGARQGKQGELEGVETFSTSAANIETIPATSVTLDGEIATQTPVELSIKKKVIKVAVPTDWNSHLQAPP